MAIDFGPRTTSLDLERKTMFSYFITGTDDDPSHSRLGVKGLGKVGVLLG